MKNKGLNRNFIFVIMLISAVSFFLSGCSGGAEMTVTGLREKTEDAASGTSENIKESLGGDAAENGQEDDDGDAKSRQGSFVGEAAESFEENFSSSAGEKGKGAGGSGDIGGNGAEGPPGMASGTDAQTEERIAVYVCGAVKAPGVYYLLPDARLYEAVELAGGFSEDADAEWLNQAERLQDGVRVQVYTKAETAKFREEGLLPGMSPGAFGKSAGAGGQTGFAGAENAAESDGAGGAPVNLNTADRETLMTLPGIGEAKADSIISYRQERGGFQSIEQIMEISGIKEAVFLKIKDRITV